MRTLSEWNDLQMKRHEAIQKMNEPHPNGVECPECKEELWDSCPNMVLTSNPPKKNVHCPACGYRGYALR